MLSRFASFAPRASFARCLSAEAAEVAKSDSLTCFVSVPDRLLMDGAEVERVTLPGRGGTFGVEKNMPPMVSELRPGVVHVQVSATEEVEFFIPGGFAFINPGNTVTVSSPEGVSLEDIDGDRVKNEVEALNSALSTAAKGSKAEAEALVGLELYKALGHALKIAV